MFSEFEKGFVSYNIDRRRCKAFIICVFLLTIFSSTVYSYNEIYLGVANAGSEAKITGKIRFGVYNTQIIITPWYVYYTEDSVLCNSVHIGTALFYSISSNFLAGLRFEWNTLELNNKIISYYVIGGYGRVKILNRYFLLIYGDSFRNYTVEMWGNCTYEGILFNAGLLISKNENLVIVPKLRVKTSLFEFDFSYNIGIWYSTLYYSEFSVMKSLGYVDLYVNMKLSYISFAYMESGLIYKF